MNGNLSNKLRFYSLDFTNESQIHTPTPIKSKYSSLYTLMGCEENIETRSERFSGDFDLMNSPYLMMKPQSCAPGFYHIRKKSTKVEFSPESLSRNNEFIFGVSEPSSPEKVSPFSSSKDLSESEDSNSDCLYQEIPSRASNPHILDDIFNNNNHIKNKNSSSANRQILQESIL